MAISTHDIVGFTKNCAGEYHVIVGVVHNDRWDLSQRDGCAIPAQRRPRGSNCLRRDVSIRAANVRSPKDFLVLCQDLLTRHEDDLPRPPGGENLSRGACAGNRALNECVHVGSDLEHLSLPTGGPPASLPRLRDGSLHVCCDSTGICARVGLPDLIEYLKGLSALPLQALIFAKRNQSRQRAAATGDDEFMPPVTGLVEQIPKPIPYRLRVNQPSRQCVNLHNSGKFGEILYSYNMCSGLARQDAVWGRATPTRSWPGVCS